MLVNYYTKYFKTLFIFVKRYFTNLILQLFVNNIQYTVESNVDYQKFFIQNTIRKDEMNIILFSNFYATVYKCYTFLPWKVQFVQ